MRLSGQLVDVAALSAHDRRAMFALMDRHYCGVNAAIFDADLAEKQWVIQIVCQVTGKLCGFSTQMLLDAIVEGRPIKALFSGDTIIDQHHWGDRILPQLGGRLALSLIDRWPNAELYWFLIAQGYKTYRFLPVFFHEFFPRYDAPTPQAIQQVIDTLSTHKFPRQFDAVAGVVRAQTTQYRLREGVADVTSERCRDPHVQFFVQQNPGHVVGDELCCIARLARDNFTDAARRVLGSER